MYNFQSTTLSRVFELVPDFVVSALGIMKPESVTRSALELCKQGLAVKSRPHPETLVSLLVKRNESVFAAIALQFRDSGRICTTVPLARCSMTMTLLQPRNRHHSLTISAKLPLFTALKKQEDLFGMTDAAASQNFWKRLSKRGGIELGDEFGYLYVRCSLS